MSTPITSALVVCVAAAGVAAGALFIQADDDDSSPASPPVAAAETGSGGGYGDSGGDAAPTAAAGASLEISGFQFGAVEVAAGGQVSVSNRDSAPHTVTADDGAFDAGEVSGGSTGSFTAPGQPGTYQFHCEIHPDMSGTLTVR